ncbi:MAG TPA: sterol desaturase family protein [Candidatus Acidoferrum sp.]|jgi:sterol desaturase/sphingolipid hydroxylase (fatty acid hydroxylase superfamily)
MVVPSHFSPLIGIPLTLAGSCLIAEFSGYWLHRLLHSDKIHFLSRGHLVHHFLIYAPGQPMRRKRYQDATDNRFSLGNIGLEWIVPSGIILAVLWSLMRLLQIQPLYQAIALATLVGWPVFMFSYLHDRMHLSDFWMARNPLLHTWFRAARRFHDIHHHAVNDHGRMDANFGIGFFLFDRVFRTIARRHRPFNRAGFETARRRYELIERGGSLYANPNDSANSTFPARAK